MKTYETSDMGLATVLSLNFPVQELINNGGRATFIFEQTTDLAAIVKGFWDRTLSVEPQALLVAYKSIKNRLYNDLPNK